MNQPEEHTGQRSRPDGPAIVPSLAGWGSFPRAFLNLLVFGLAIAGGEWLVHQGEYLIEYRRAFGTVMAASPQHGYMDTLGLIFAGAAIALLTLSACVLGVHSLRLRRLLRLLPGRLERLVPTVSVRIPVRTVVLTVALAAVAQILLYLVQENLEAVSAGAGWPGLAVLFAPRHATVVPLHLLIAFYTSLLLWTLATFLQSSGAAVDAARVLADLLASLHAPPRRLVPAANRIPSLRLVRGTHGLRSPPLAVGF
jgi:hypothetical protein